MQPAGDETAAFFTPPPNLPIPPGMNLMLADVVVLLDERLLPDAVHPPATLRSRPDALSFGRFVPTFDFPGESRATF